MSTESLFLRFLSLVFGISCPLWRRERHPSRGLLEQPQSGHAACQHLHPDPWASQVVKQPHPGRVIVADPQSQPRTAATIRDPNLGGTLKADAKTNPWSPLRV